MAEGETRAGKSTLARYVGVDHHTLLVAPVAGRIPLQREPVVRAEIHVHGASGDDHARRARGVVEQRDGHIRRQSCCEVVQGEDGADTGIGELPRDVVGCAVRIEEERAPTVRRGEGRQERGAAGQENGGPCARQRPHEWRRALQEGDAGGDQRRRLTGVEAPAAGRDGEREQGERIRHGSRLARRASLCHCRNGSAR